MLSTAMKSSFSLSSGKHFIRGRIVSWIFQSHIKHLQLNARCKSWYYNVFLRRPIHWDANSCAIEKCWTALCRLHRRTRGTSGLHSHTNTHTHIQEAPSFCAARQTDQPYHPLTHLFALIKRWNLSTFDLVRVPSAGARSRQKIYWDWLIAGHQVTGLPGSNSQLGIETFLPGRRSDNINVITLIIMLHSLWMSCTVHWRAVVFLCARWVAVASGHCWHLSTAKQLARTVFRHNGHCVRLPFGHLRGSGHLCQVMSPEN